MTDAIRPRGDEPAPITPREKKMYEQEYKHGAQLFQKALHEYTKSDSQFQQHEFGEVMEKAMKILNQTAAELNQQALLEQNNKIKGDFDKFMKDPANTKSVNQLDKDLDQAKKSIS